MLRQGQLIADTMSIEGRQKPFNGAEPEQELEVRQGEPVLVDGRLGSNVRLFALTDLRVSQLGTGGYNEIFFETLSGNIYHVYRLDRDNLAIVDAKGNKGRRNELYGSILSPSEVEQAVLKVGEVFAFGKGSSTSEIVRIIAVTGKQFVSGQPDADTTKRIADRETRGNVTDIKQRFERQLQSE
jgi:hypothetical protein